VTDNVGDTSTSPLTLETSLELLQGWTLRSVVSVLVFLSIPDAIVCALALAHRAVIWPELRLVGSPRALYLMVSTCHLFLLQDNCRGALLAAVCHNALLVMLLNAPVLQSETGKASGFVQVHQAESANVTLNANPCRRPTHCGLRWRVNTHAKVCQYTCNGRWRVNTHAKVCQYTCNGRWRVNTHAKVCQYTCNGVNTHAMACDMARQYTCKSLPDGTPCEEHQQ